MWIDKLVLAVMSSKVLPQKKNQHRILLKEKLDRRMNMEGRSSDLYVHSIYP